MVLHCALSSPSFYSNILGGKGKAVEILDDLFLHFLLRNMNEQSIFYISDKKCWFAISSFVFVRIQRMIHTNFEGQFTAVTPIIFVVTKYDIYC